MDQRQLIAYSVLLLMVAGLAWAWHYASRERRAGKRASSRAHKARVERRASAREEEEEERKRP